jgi:uncharacterized membrane protein
MPVTSIISSTKIMPEPGIMLAKEEVIELDMSVDEAFKLVISTGVVTPT